MFPHIRRSVTIQSMSILLLFLFSSSAIRAYDFLPNNNFSESLATPTWVSRETLDNTIAQPGLTPSPESKSVALSCSSGNHSAVERCHMNGIDVIKVNLNDSRIRIKPVIAPNGGLAPLSSLAGGAIAAINGDYQLGSCTNGVNCGTGLTYVNGQNYTMGPPDSYNYSRSMAFNQSLDPNIGFPPEQGGHLWHVLGGGPRFTAGGAFRWVCGDGSQNRDCPNQGGTVVINDEYFKPSATNWWNRPQSAIGFSDDGNTIYLAASAGNVTMQSLHDVLWQLGSRNNLKLDGGSARTLYYNDGPGHYLYLGQGIGAPNAWVVYESNEPTPTPAPPPGDCNVEAERVVLYSDPDFGGSCRKLGVGDYPNPGHLNPVGNDNTKSLRVGANLRVTLYEHNNYQGRHSVFTPSEVHNLRDTEIGYDTSSVRVEKLPPPQPTPTHTHTPVPPTPTHTPTHTPTPIIQLVEDLTLSPSEPLVGETITARYKIKNVSGGTLTIHRLLVGAKGPDCTEWDCANWGDFPYEENISLAPGQEHVFEQRRLYTEAGNGYFAQAIYQTAADNWNHIGRKIDFTVSPGLEVAQDVGLTPASPLVDEPVKAQFQLRNSGNRPIVITRLGVAGGGPGCSDFDCDGWGGFPAVDNITIQPNQTYVYETQRSYPKAGNYFAHAVFNDINGSWFPLPASERINFTVKPGIELVEDLTLSPPAPVAGEIITAHFKIKNASDQMLTLRRVMVGAKGPDCTAWDCQNWGDFPHIEDVTLQPDESYIYSQQRVYTQAGSGYFAQPIYQFAENNWNHIGAKHDFAVAPGLQLVEPLTLSPQNPRVGQTVTAQYTIKNVSSRTVTLPLIGVVARGPNCTDWECADGWADFPVTENVTLPAGEQYVYRGQRSFEKTGTGYFADAAFADHNPWWHEIPGNTRVDFSVITTGEIATVSAGKGTVSAGGKVTLPVLISNLPNGIGVGSATVEIHYDDASLSIISCNTNPDEAFDLVQCNTGTSGVVRLSAISTAGATGELTLATLEWQAQSGAKTTPLEVQVVAFSDAAGEPIAVQGQDGEIQVENYKIGDANCDTNVNVTDALFILQHDVGMRSAAQQCPLPANTLLLPACDVNGDSNCNVVDALFVLQCDVGIANSFCPARAAAEVEDAQSLTAKDVVRTEVTVGSGQVDTDGRIRIPITATAQAGTLGAATLDVRYDPSLLSVINCTADPETRFNLAQCNRHVESSAPGHVRLSLVSAAGAGEDLRLAEILLQPVGVEGITTLTVEDLTFADTDGVLLAVTVWDGTVEITDSTPAALFLPLLIR